MKSAELRIGNLVEYLITDEFDERKEWWEINTIDVDDLREIEKGNTNYRPIPLTETLILKFGFRKRMFTDGSEYLELDKTDYAKFGNPIHVNTEIWKCYRFQFYKGEWYFGVYKDPTSNQYFVQKKVRFVHQLQNIYFALTDEELSLYVKQAPREKKL